MAEITNKVKKIDRKKALYDHVSFDDLYGYNEPIQTIREVSKKLFTQYILAGKQHWNSLIESKGLIHAHFGLFRGDVDHELFFVPVTDLRDGVEQEEAPERVYFSIEEIVEPYDIHFDPKKEASSITSRLSQYIELGLYPLVSTPMSEDELFNAFEKYDEVCPGRRVIGTIVDINQEADADLNVHYFATIMWNPETWSDMERELRMSKNGFLALRDMVKTPQCWRDPNEDTIANFGIPVYEYQPMAASLAIINTVADFPDYINEAVVTGNLSLDFVKSTLSMATATAERMANQITKGHWEPKVEERVVYEDASVDDDFGHRLHLYDEPTPPDTDDDDVRLG